MSNSILPETRSPTEVDRLDAGYYAVRIGVHGQVGRFTTASENFRRGTRVICRTARGLEIGSVLNRLRQSGSAEAADGQIVRRLTSEDQLLWSHLQELALQSQTACQAWLNASQSLDQLLEVEPLFDGRTLYFHFLNDVSADTETQLDRLASIFQETVASSHFSRLLEHGCGPGCGTADATRGCGGACSTCAVSSRCAVKR
jgi:cell fate regulator YaaT (PSP1 superfamily)